MPRPSAPAAGEVRSRSAPNLRRAGVRVLAAAAIAAALLSLPAPAAPATLSDPAVDAFNVRVGTQTFAPKYRFTSESALVETAEAIRSMGSDVIKFAMGRGVERQYGIPSSGSITSLAAQARDEPSCRRVLDMPFRHFLIWSYPFASRGDTPWRDGFSAGERQREYDEIHAFTRHLLTRYAGSGKSFYLGHWEGDWYLLPNYNTRTNPSPETIQGMIDWLNTRQQAVDDATRDTPHHGVQVYHYTEVNRVRDAMLNGPDSNRRLVNTVLPAVTNIDFVSWSSYDGQDLGEPELRATLDYIESRLPSAKAASIPGRRVMIGEYGWGGTLSSEAQEPRTRAYLRRLLPWSPRFILFWEIYDNEGRAFWLVDRHGARTPCHDLHARFLNQARLRTAQFRETHGRLPGDAEFAGLVTPILDAPILDAPILDAPILDAPIPPPVALAWSGPETDSLTATSAVVRATLIPGLYGQDVASVSVHWGRRDGGTHAEAWEHRCELGDNPRFNPSPFTARLELPPAPAGTFVRFRARNTTAEAWSAPWSAPAAPAP